MEKKKKKRIAERERERERERDDFQNKNNIRILNKILKIFYEKNNKI